MALGVFGEVTALRGAYQRVWEISALTADATGNVVVTHGLGATPTEYWIVDTDNATTNAQVTTWTVTDVGAVTCKVYRVITAAGKGSTLARLFLRTEHTIQSGRNAM